MYRSYPEFTAKRLTMAKSAPKSPAESWTDSHRRPSSANGPLTNWRYLLNRRLDKGPYDRHVLVFGLRLISLLDTIMIEASTHSAACFQPSS